MPRPLIRHINCERHSFAPFCEKKPFALFRPLHLDEIEYEDVKDFHDLKTYPQSFETDIDVLQWLCAMAGESVTARAMLEDAQCDGWTVRFDDLGQSGYATDYEEASLTLDHYGFKPQGLGKSAFFRHLVLINFVRLLRHLWHERTAEQGEISKYRPEALLMIERARAADRETAAVLCAWEMREAGHHDTWRFALGSSEGDMAAVFADIIERNPHSLEDGSALARTFCEWYKSADRVAASDHATLEDMDEILEDSPYESPFGKGGIHASLIEKISELPNAGAYLSGMGRTICTDPYFASITDAINEMHLFQVTYDTNVVRVEGVPFRDAALADLIFPSVIVKA